MNDDTRDKFSALGKSGGAKLRETRGADYFRELGKRGGEKLRDTRGMQYYRDIGLKGGAVTKENAGPDYYSTIGRKGGQHPKPPRGMAFADLAIIEPRLSELLMKARRWDTSSAGGYCELHAMRQLRKQLDTLVGWYAVGADERVRTSSAWETCHKAIYGALARCAHPVDVPCW
jgi:general stress protein YciG